MRPIIRPSIGALDGTRWLDLTRTRLAFNAKSRQAELLINPLAGKPGVRMNDGKVDPAGRFWAGV